MKRSVLWDVAGLALAAAGIMQAVCLAVVFAMPAPPPTEMTIADVSAALSGEKVRGVRVVPGAALAASRVSPLLTQSTAAALHVDPRRVRAWWIEPPRFATRAQGETIAVVAGQEAVVRAKPGGFDLRSGVNARIGHTTALPPFAAALQAPSGAWRVVRPAPPLLTPWRGRLIVMTLLGTLLIGPVTWLAARRLTAPIRTLAAAARSLELGSADAFAPVSGPREVQDAAEALNATRARLQAELVSRTRMLAAVAHDLRNPLTSLRLRIEKAPEPDRVRLLRDLSRMTAMVDQVMDLSRAREAPLMVAEVDLARVVREIGADAREAGRPVIVCAPQRGAMVSADEVAVRRAILNLVDNALTYAGSARVEVERQGASVSVHVEDDGPGLPEAALESLKEPFARLEPSRSRATGGTGLGLTIAAEIMTRHGGALTLANRRPQGLCATLEGFKVPR